MLKEIKVSYKSEIKRFELPKTFRDLREIISKSFNLNKDFQITYLDDEQDSVIISNEFDFEQTLIFMDKQNFNLLRLTILVNESNNIDFKINISQGSSLNLSPSPKIIKKPDPMVEMRSISKIQIENLDPQITAISKIMDRNDSQVYEKIDSLKTKLQKMQRKKEIQDILNKVKAFKKHTQKHNISFSLPNQNMDEYNNSEYLDCKKIDDIIRTKRQNIVKKFSEKLIQKVKDKIMKAKNEMPSIPEESYKKKNIKAKTVSIKKMDKVIKESISEHNKQLKEFMIDLIDKKFNELTKTLSNSQSIPIKEDKMIQKEVASINHISSSSVFKESIIHPNTICKGCSLSPIKGILYRCSVCKDFNLCSICEEKLGASHKHNFIKYRSGELNLIDTNIISGKSCCMNIEDKKILNSKLFSTENIYVNEGCNESRFEIIIENNGMLNWPVPCFFRNIEGVKGNKVSIQQIVPPGKFYKIILCFVSSNLGCGEYNSKWQLFDDKNNSIGQAIEFKVIVTSRKKKHRFINLLGKIRERYHLVGISEDTILEALEKSQGNPDEAIIYLV